MQDAPYEQWFGFLQARLPHLEQLVVADLGCGTGKLTHQLASACRRVIGVDLSEEMLSRAANFALERRLNSEWLCQDMRALHLPYLADVVVSTSDSLNYLLTEDDLLQTFQRVAANLQPRGWFYFDLLGLGRLRALQEGFSYDLEATAAVLFETEVTESGRVLYDVHAFVSEGGLFYRRLHEQHVQQYFSLEVAKRCLAGAGFELIEQSGDFGHQTWNDAMRFVLAARKQD
ncbi:MAG: hypothetical protein A2201_12960 [Alicyclobacillus sp. RIFOXYA1_FULL_53_8]|nr:MAG: hypothetical protein A2201_12960 [Alicyclobacillus sp. RIFOXYA1_FULL_53_8]